MKNQGCYVKYALLTFGRFVDKIARESAETQIGYSIPQYYDTSLERRFCELMVLYLVFRPR